MPPSLPYPLLTVIMAALAAVGPFSIDTYLPAFGEIAADLGASRLEVQQTLTAYMATFAVMVLWHGTLSDSFGRRRVLIVSLSCYMLASLVCMLAPSIEWLWLGRALQGLSAGSGMVVGRALGRDLLSGPAAQRLFSHVTMVFAIAPAIAPIVGGALLALAGWRSIFAALALFGLALSLVCALRLPETLPPESRQPLHPLSLLRAYRQVLARPAFISLGAALSFNFAGFFLYVLSAPAFLIGLLGLDAQSFGWFFVPSVAGMMAGAMTSARVAERWPPARTIATGYAVMLGACAINLGISAALPPALPWSLLFAPVYTFGMALAMPSLTLLALDLFPDRKGLASSCQGFLQMGGNALSAALLAPRLWSGTGTLALGSSTLLLCGGALFLGWWRGCRPPPDQPASPR